jgi:hypothetical protein
MEKPDGNYNMDFSLALNALNNKPLGFNDEIDTMVCRFLNWPLPRDFKPDNGISVDRLLAPYGQIGSNLFTYEQAHAMVHHILKGVTKLELRDD